MGKVKKNRQSLKWAFAWYLPICLLFSIIGSFGIGVATNYLQDWYRYKYPELTLSDSYYELHISEDNHEYVVYTDHNGDSVQPYDRKRQATYWIISNTQMLLIPLWVIFCIVLTGAIFYNRELKNPINILLDASRKIADNQLDFKVEYKKQNEFGMLCTTFDEMRLALYESNQEMWRSLEERKRLNSAIAHDLRTPLTVLKGYADFLEKYIPDGKVSEEKLLSVLSMMNGQISRLEHYTKKMNAVQKLEDIVPNNRDISSVELVAMLTETGTLICGKQFRINSTPDDIMISIDTELVMQVYENLISNAVRYAEKSIESECNISENMLTISVLDDGKGFTDEALINAAQPFFRDDKEPDKLHFGLGLYICRIICEKCGGTLTVENHENGGKVTAKFCCKEISKSR
ncbi:MAG: HAMP domain-containing histidine kinase [Ruminococcus sp.]|nr:HAMP domain-containing histidine kinase [Ruminococcus sp.]MBP3797396.1 HAMP domain-containing histidine kinase [Ruminococcus sp.]